MSADDVLTERDAAALESGRTSPDDDDDTPELEELRAEVERQADLIKDLFKKVNRLEDQLSGSDPATAGTTLVEKFSQMDPGERDDLIGATDRRAVALFEHWWDIAKQAGNGNYVITTHRNSQSKHQPSQVKLDLEKATGKDLAWEQVYRAMRQLAKLSVPERDDTSTSTDEYGRKTIAGGAFEYHEKATPDGSDTYKLVELADANSLTLL